MSAQIGDKDPVIIPGIPVAIGVIATPTLVEVNPKAIAMGDKFVRVIPETYDAEILYVINKYNVRSSELKKDEMAGLAESIKSAPISIITAISADIIAFEVANPSRI